jgi:D-alanine-D-alanine ligase
MRILIAFNEPVLPITHPEAGSEREVLDVVVSVMSRLDRPGVELSQLGVDRDWVAIREAVRRVQPDAVLNLFEGFGDDPNSECEFARLLEDEGVPYSGASAELLWRTGRKDIAKQILSDAGLATPAGIKVDGLPLADCMLNWPVIVKPAHRDASVGIHQSSVVTRLSELNKQIAQTAQRYGFPVLVEEFINGREISVALFDWPELTVLPIVETNFARANGNWPIDSYDAKWKPGSHDHQASTLQYPAGLTAKLANNVVAAAKAAYRVLDCRGFVTIDFRIRDQVPYILEVNSNADLKPSTCLTDLLQLSGIDYNDFLWQMICSAHARKLSHSERSEKSTLPA